MGWGYDFLSDMQWQDWTCDQVMSWDALCEFIVAAGFFFPIDSAGHFILRKDIWHRAVHTLMVCVHKCPTRMPFCRFGFSFVCFSFFFLFLLPVSVCLSLSVSVLCLCLPLSLSLSLSLLPPSLLSLFSDFSSKQDRWGRVGGYPKG